MSPKEYEDAIVELARDLRMNVAANLDKTLIDVSCLEETAHNAADLLLHNLTVIRMVRSILQDKDVATKATSLLRALDKILEAAEPPRVEQSDMQLELAAHRQKDAATR